MILLDQDLFFIEVIFNVFIIIDKSTRHRWGSIEGRVKLDARVFFKRMLKVIGAFWFDQFEKIELFSKKLGLSSWGVTIKQVCAF